jgi:hypothetical protein
MLRQVRLKAAYADLYSSFEPGVWYTAAAVAAFVKGRMIVEDGPQIEIRERVLSAEHFEFRGGGDSRGSWGENRTRRTDRKFPRSRERHRQGQLQVG